MAVLQAMQQYKSFLRLQVRHFPSLLATAAAGNPLAALARTRTGSWSSWRVFLLRLRGQQQELASRIEFSDHNPPPGTPN